MEMKILLCTLALTCAATGLAQARTYDIASLATVGGTWGMMFSPDSTTMAVVSDSNSVFLWDTSTWAMKSRLEGHTQDVRSVAFSQDGATIASASNDKTVKLWDAKTGKLKRTIDNGASAFSTAFSPDGKSLVVGGESNDAAIYDTSTGAVLIKLSGHKDVAWTAAFSPDGALVATGSKDKTIRLYNSATGKCNRILKGHTKEVNAVVFSPDGKTIASASLDSTIKLWDTKTGDCKQTIYAHGGGVTALAYSPDGMAFASMGKDGVGRVWDARTNELARVLREVANCVSFSPNGKFLAIGTDHCLSFVWDWKALGNEVKSANGRRDLRPEFDRLGIAAPRNQNPRGTCSVFATTDAIGFALAKRRGKGEFMSVEFLNWTSHTINNSPPDGDGSYFDGCIRGFEKYGVCAERLMPYNNPKRVTDPPSEEAMADAEANRKVGLKFHAIDQPVLEVNSPARQTCTPMRRDTDGYIAKIKETIDRGYPVAAGAFHSILLVGYVDDPTYEGGGSFIARDSASVSYRDLSYTFIKYRMTEFCWFE